MYGKEVNPIFSKGGEKNGRTRTGAGAGALGEGVRPKGREERRVNTFSKRGRG